MAPNKTQQWVIEGSQGFDQLKFQSDVEIPKLGDHDCLVEIKAASLNYRDLTIAKGTYIFPLDYPVVPASDGSGTIVAVGSRVSEFKTGDKVCPVFNQRHYGGSLAPKDARECLGGPLDGTLRQHGVFEEKSLVRVPESLSFEEAATLPCAAVTAWNSLYGLTPLKPGEWVLTQGTGGVSIFAVQFAIAAGAKVIATTSSEAKAKRLKELGVHHVVNYKEDQNWGETAKKLTPGEVGVHNVIEVGGPKSLEQSLKAVKIDGIISVIGFLGGVQGGPSPLETLSRSCIIRGIRVGSRLLFQEMNDAIEANGIKPVIDSHVFDLKDTKEAYQYMWDQKHFGKVVVKVQ